MSLSSKQIPNPALKPFRFQAFWLTHHDYTSVLENEWKSQNCEFLSKINTTTRSIREWAKENFGNILKEKRIILARLGGIQKVVEHRNNKFLKELESSLIVKLEDILKQEEILWQQKARQNWLQNGDRNTRFFHMATVIRRRHNKIEGLKDATGNWVYEKEEIKKTIVDFFSDLFSVDNGRAIPDDWPNLFENESFRPLGLNCGVMEDDIKKALFFIGPMKAPGEDGLPALFLQQAWDVCKSNLVSFIQNCFITASIPEGLNSTLMTLIPKVPNPSTVSDLRPISLCNTAYKIITKIIVSKIKPSLPSFISLTQVSFVPGRHITDNIFLLQEMMHKFKTTTGKKGYVAWKIDLSKAYDRVSWVFIMDLLKEIGMEDTLRKLIW